MKTLLDTTVLIDALQNEPEAIRLLREMQQDGAIFHTSTINLFEIMCGILRSERRREQRLEAFDVLMANIAVIPLDATAARKAAELHAQFNKSGKTMASSDCLIAGCALSQGIDSVVTRNQKHFEGIRGLRVVAY